jgi:hypothetical protein
MTVEMGDGEYGGGVAFHDEEDTEREALEDCPTNVS